MSKAIKELVKKDLHTRYDGLESVLVVNVHGLKGNEVNDFRGQLMKGEIDIHVVKNSAARRALAGSSLEPLAKRLSGPCAFVTGGVGPVDVAKELIRLSKEFPALELKEGIVDGDPELLTIEDISKRKSKAELQGEIIMLAASPARRLAGQINVGGKVAGCVKAIVEKLEKGETISKVA